MNHYDCIGFTDIKNIHDDQSLWDFIERIKPHTQNCRDYYVYADPSGAQLWLCLDENNALDAFEPYFSGSLHTGFVVTAQPNSQADGTGFAQIWQNGTRFTEDGGCLDGYYPFIVDIPDMAAFPENVAGSVQTVSVCAFAENAEWFADEAAYDASQANEELRYAAKNFIPSGMFINENAPDGTRPSATAWFTGFVYTAEKRINHLSGSPFYYCEIDTHGGIWSAVYPAEAFADTPPVGSIIKGEYWLTGRLADAPSPKIAQPEKRGFWQKLFGR